MNPIIQYISLFQAIVWLLPVFRQKNSSVFFYFLILASDIISPVLWEVFEFAPYKFITALALLIPFSLYKEFFRKNLIYFFFVFIIGFLVIYAFDSPDLQFIQFPAHLFAFVIFCREVIIKYFYNRTIDFYYIVFVFYEISFLLKLITLITDTNTGVNYYFITTLFQVLIGIFFIIFKEDSPSVTYHL